MQRKRKEQLTLEVAWYTLPHFRLRQVFSKVACSVAHWSPGSRTRRQENSKHAWLLKTLCPWEQLEGEPFSTQVSIIYVIISKCLQWGLETRSSSMKRLLCSAWKFQSGTLAWLFISPMISSRSCKPPFDSITFVCSHYQDTPVVSVGFLSACFGNVFFLSICYTLCSFPFSWYMLNNLTHWKLQVQPILQGCTMCTICP